MSVPDLVPAAPSRLVTIDAYPLGEDVHGEGWVRFSLLSDLRVISTGQIIQASTVQVDLVGGKGEILLPTRSSAVTDDCGDEWIILVKKSWADPYAIIVPAGSSDLALGDLAPARPLTRREELWAITSASVSVTTLAPGSSASGTVTLTSGALAFNLRVPRGAQGLPGPGALAADDAVATYIGSPSQTRSALDHAYRRGYSPREWGVVGDGVADDTAAWNTAIASVPAGSTLVCPEGDTYKLTGPVNVGKALTIEGGHFLPHTTGRALNITASNVAVRGTRFTAATAAVPDTTHQIIAAVGTSVDPLTGIVIDGVTIDKTRYHGVWLEWVTDSKVTNATVTDFQYAGVMLISVTRVEVSGCVIRNGIQDAPIVNTYGIAATDLDNSFAARSRDVLITRNTVDNIPGWEGIDTHGGERITITDNIITRCRDGIAAVAGSSSRVTAPRDVVISGNSIDSGDIIGRSGIRLYGISGGEQASAAIGSNIIRGDYLMEVEAAHYEVAATRIQAQAGGVTGGYSSHPAPYRQWAAVAAVSRNGASSTTTITLPPGVFTKPPMVFVTPQGGANPAVGWTWRVSSASETQVVIVGEGPVGLINVSLGILCVQMSSADRSGVPTN